MREEDPELAAEMDEKEAVKRMKERMTLAHKNTSKWARQQLRRGNINTETRRALSAQVAEGDKLRKKQVGDENGRDDDSGSDSEGEDMEGLKRKARRILEGAEEDEDKGEREGSKSGLFELAFMKKGLETQREKAKKEARELLEELEGGSEGGEEADDEDEMMEKEVRRSARSEGREERSDDRILLQHKN